MLPEFPTFAPLTLELKEPYNQKIGEFPPYSDTSFATIQVWWSVSENLSVALLNGNLVIDYNLFSDPDAAGLGLVGTNAVDASIRQLFEYLNSHRRPVRLVHVPEFTLDAVNHKDGLDIEEEVNFKEYILDSAGLAKLEGPQYKSLRKKIKRFTKHVGERQLELKALDLSLAEIKDKVFQSIVEWEHQNNKGNDLNNDEHQALKRTLGHAEKLDIKNLGLYIDKKLHGIVTYHRPSSQQYYILHHLKANYENPYITDYLYHQVAKQAVQDKVSHLNIEMDLGIENLKQHKLTLRPTHYLRKYTIKPKTS